LAFEFRSRSATLRVSPHPPSTAENKEKSGIFRSGQVTGQLQPDGFFVLRGGVHFPKLCLLIYGECRTRRHGSEEEGHAQEGGRKTPWICDAESREWAKRFPPHGRGHGK
jgi:hypothetical protein